MTHSHWHRTTRPPDAAFDVVVVGGGIIGASTAYWLAHLRPTLRVALVEASTLAHGASGRNAGFLLQGTSTDYVTDCATYGNERARRLWQFTLENRELVASELSPQTFHMERSGSLTVAGSPAEYQRLQESVSRLRAVGFPVALIGQDEANKRLMAQGFYGALYVPMGAMLNPVLLVRHIAERSGVRVFEHHRVLAAHPFRDGAYLETSQRNLQADQVVLALNAYLPQLYPQLAAYVQPVRAQMLATQPVHPRWLTVPAYTHEGYYYIRQQRDGTVLLGGARHLHLDAELGYADATTPALQQSLETYLHHHFPQTRGLQVYNRWSGTMGFSPDHLPVVGPVPDLPGSYWAAGFTGHGMGYGFRFGRMLAEHTLGFPDPEGLDLFGIERLEQKKTKPSPKA